MIERGPWQGMLTIARLNWPYYAAALAAMVLSAVSGFWLAGVGERLVCGAIFLAAAWFVFGSLGVSHLVYDRSDLYRLGWLARALKGSKRGRFICCHCGFDDFAPALRERLGEGEWLILDHYRPQQMTEASIRRARWLFPPSSDARPADFDHWPVETNSAELVFGVLAIHELRSEEERRRWFGEARRCLNKDGRIILAEHLRDFANFFAFGPGFLHFHSRASWRRAWERAGFRAVEEFSITPWIRVFVLSVDSGSGDEESRIPDEGDKPAIQGDHSPGRIQEIAG